MVTLIHGDDTASSRKYLIEEKGKIKDPFVFDGEKMSLSDLIQVLQGGGLFTNDKNIFIENFFKRKQSNEFNEIINLAEKYSKEANIYLWEAKELTKKQISFFKNPKNVLFKLPLYLFSFLDNIRPKNGKNLLFMLHTQLTTLETEFIFHMLIRQFRMLLALSSCHTEQVSGSEQIDEVKRLAPWQKSKLQKQASLFSIDELKTIYKKLYETDLGQKTGTLNLSLQQAIDILLLDI